MTNRLMDWFAVLLFVVGSVFLFLGIRGWFRRWRKPDPLAPARRPR